MGDGVCDILARPFQEGLLAAEKAFLIRGDFSAPLKEIFGPDLLVEQTDRLAYERLRTGGMAVTTRLERFEEKRAPFSGSETRPNKDFEPFGESISTKNAREERYGLGLCVLTAHRLESYANIARAYRHLAPGGTLLCGGPNTVGAATYEKAVARKTEIAGRLSKAKCRLFWLTRPAPAATDSTSDSASAGWEEWRSLAAPRPIGNGAFTSVPGIFSWDRIDPGSQVLVDHLPPGIKGRVADLGAGWGFLSAALLKACGGIGQLDLYEAEKLALDRAEANLSALGAGRAVRFFWRDVCQGVGPELGSKTGAGGGENSGFGAYDWIVTNPPFHRAGVQDIGLGVSFLQVAARALRAGGHLLCVANRHLPYERVLAGRDGFKVVLARK